MLLPPCINLVVNEFHDPAEPNLEQLAWQPSYRDCENRLIEFLLLCSLYYPLEVHMVHTNQFNETLVIATFLVRV